MHFSKTTFRSCLLLAFALFLLDINPTFAQDPSHNQPEKHKKSFYDRFEWVGSQQHGIHEINFMGGYSFHSTKGFWGKIPETTFRIYTIRYNRKLLTFNRRHLIEYVGELNVSAHYNISRSTKYNAATFTGFGIRPVGFQFNWGKEHVIQPFLKSSTGFMYFKERFPDARGNKFNFTLELGGGFEFVLAKHFSFSIGYKYHHMSNGQLGEINPGVDSNIFYTGLTFF
jgi:opacity protein-like surface antigen